MEHAQLGPILTCWRSSEEKEGGWRHGASAVRSYTNLLAVIRGEGEEGGHAAHAQLGPILTCWRSSEEKGRKVDTWRMRSWVL